MRTVRTMFFVAVLFVSLPSGAVPKNTSRFSPQTEPQKKVLPHDVLAYFSGAWSGKGKFATGEPIASDISFVPDLDNQCLLVREKEKPPNTFQFVGVWSMDSVSGDLVMLSAVHNSGARVFRSHGWQDGKIVFQSVPELRAQFGLERFTFERKSDATFDSTFEVSTDNGRTWRVGDRQEYTKVPSR